MKTKRFLIFLSLWLTSCNIASPLPSNLPQNTETSTSIPTSTATPLPPSATSTLTSTPTQTPLPIVESLKAVVIKDKLVCRYGPGANYLYLFAYNNGAKIKLIGQAFAANWVLVENEPQKCWVNSEFLQIDGNFKQLNSMYPDGYKIPVSPYYGPTTVLSATREGDEITISWIEVIVSPGKYENENMFPYIVEVWHCVNGEFIFETLGTTYPAIKFIDHTNCDQPSHGRVYIQEKHGYAGPADIPWPGD